MPVAKLTLLVLLGLMAMSFCAAWYFHLVRQGKLIRPSAYQTLVGFITDFLDTLGIGSFATTTALYRARRTVADEHLPGTLNVGHALPTIVQAFIYISVVEIEVRTLWLLIVASVLGAWLGAGVVTRWSRRKIQLGMGVALLVAAALILGRLLEFFPPGGDAPGAERGTPGGCLRRQFRVRRPDDDRSRRLRTHHDHGELAGHEPQGRVSVDDGFLRVFDAGGQHPFHTQRQVRCRRRHRFGLGRHTRRVAGGFHRQGTVVGRRSLARGRGGAIYRNFHALVCEEEQERVAVMWVLAPTQKSG